MKYFEKSAGSATAWRAIPGLLGAGAGAAAGGKDHRLAGAAIGGAAGVGAGHVVGKNIGNIVHKYYAGKGANLIDKTTDYVNTAKDVVSKQSKNYTKTKKYEKSFNPVFQEGEGIISDANKAGKKFNKMKPQVGEFAGIKELKSGIGSYKSLFGDLVKRQKDFKSNFSNAFTSNTDYYNKNYMKKKASINKTALNSSTIAAAIRGRANNLKKVSKTNVDAFLKGNEKTFKQINNMARINPNKIREAMSAV